MVKQVADGSLGWKPPFIFHRRLAIFAKTAIISPHHFKANQGIWRFSISGHHNFDTVGQPGGPYCLTLPKLRRLGSYGFQQNVHSAVFWSNSFQHTFRFWKWVLQKRYVVYTIPSDPNWLSLTIDLWRQWWAVKTLHMNGCQIKFGKRAWKWCSTCWSGPYSTGNGGDRAPKER